MLLNARTWAIAVLQSLVVFCALIIAWSLRFEFAIPQRRLLLCVVPLLVLIRLAAMARFNLLHGYWRYTGVNDLEDILKATVLGSCAFIVSVRYVLGLKAFPLSVYLLEAILTAAFLTGVRVLARSIMQELETRKCDSEVVRRVLVVGAGDAADLLIRELPRNGYDAVGCVDDDQRKQGAKVHGVPVLGTIDSVPEIVSAQEIDEIFIAIPSATAASKRRIVDVCQHAGCKFRMVPGLRDLIEGKVTVGQLREVELEDLLGRDPVEMNLEGLRGEIEGRVIMVTGAAGSIGSELCRQILDNRPAKLICLDQAETPLFYLQLSLRKHELGSRTAFVVADIADTERMRKLFVDYRVEATFHAAAYKHVPMMEANLREALKNNVFALLSLLDLAETSCCKRFLLISSDKAVHPTSFMGCTKRLGELIIAARPHSRMRCVSVRFGNVLGSQGSVVPIFQKQIRTTQRITITHPEITRYFMTIPEAVSLVLEAFAIGQHGNVLVLDMGDPVRIVDLAKTLIRLSGKREDQVTIAYTGLRPGEKLFEELFYASEEPLATAHEKIKCARSKVARWPQLTQDLRDLRELMLSGTESSIRAKVKEIIPEYSYAADACASEMRPVRLPITEAPSPTKSPALNNGIMATNA